MFCIFTRDVSVAVRVRPLVVTLNPQIIGESQSAWSEKAMPSPLVSMNTPTTPGRSHAIHWQTQSVNANARALLKSQRPVCVWLTGLSGAGKSTLSNLLDTRMHALGLHTYVLDGDNFRHGLCSDLGFSDADRVENIRRAAEVAKLMVDAGLIVIVSFISPFRADRALARAKFAPGQFFEVFVDTSLEECMQRDPKGLYAKAQSGELKNFTGLDSPYEPPLSPEVHVRTAQASPEACAEAILCKVSEATLAHGPAVSRAEG